MKHSPGQLNHQENDEYYTPPILVGVILPYVKKNSTIWCPFDTAESEFVIQLENEGHTVIHSHIIDGYDFFELLPPTCDYIISNPPFSRKNDVFKRLFKMGIPFAMVMLFSNFFLFIGRNVMANTSGKYANGLLRLIISVNYWMIFYINIP